MDSHSQADADVLVIGAGVAGLSCAAALSDCGMRVTVLEASDHLGGRAASWIDEITGDTVDIGPHVVSSEHRNFMALLERLGTADLIRWQPDPLITLLDARRQLRMHAPAWPPPLHGLPNLRNVLRCLGPGDLLSNLRVAWRAARLDAAGTQALDGEDGHSFLRRQGVSPRAIDWFWRSSMLAVLNVPLEACSAAAMMRVFRLMLGRSGYCFGFPKVGLSQLFAPGCRRAVEAAGGEVATGAAVHAISGMAEGRFKGVVLADGRTLRAGACVLAVPPEALAALGMPAVKLKASRYVSTMLWFDRRLTDQLFWARVLAPGDLNTDFYDLSNIRERGPTVGSLIVSNAIHAEAAWTSTDEELVAHTWREIAEFAPVADSAALLHSRIHRIPLAVPCPAPGTERLRPSPATALAGLWLAGDWTATGLPCSMESAARSGAIAAEHVAAAHGRSLQIALPPPETVGPVAALRRRSPEPAAPR